MKTFINLGIKIHSLFAPPKFNSNEIETKSMPCIKQVFKIREEFKTQNRCKFKRKQGSLTKDSFRI